jgi:CRP-like cAMP-binding protein
LPISFGKAKEDDVASLIASRKYARAVELLKARLRRKGANPSLRMQLADVLILAEKKQEAVALLLPLADQYARDGFAAKAVSVLKRIQKVDPGRRDVEERLARQIGEKQREAVDTPTPAAFPSLEIGLEAIAPVSAPADLPSPAPVPPATTTADDGVEDYDLLYAGDSDEEEAEPLLEADVAEETPAAEAMSPSQFADELMGLVDSVFQESPAAATPLEDAPRAPSQIVVSPLFRDFSVDEMVAVIHGLRLLTFERGGVILREGQPGGSLYTLASGRVRAFRRDPATGKQKPIGDLREGAFFGEMSILTGQPRMASVVALSRCELLELDRPTLEEIARTHPHVWDVLREFAKERAARLLR